MSDFQSFINRSRTCKVDYTSLGRRTKQIPGRRQPHLWVPQQHHAHKTAEADSQKSSCDTTSPSLSDSRAPHSELASNSPVYPAAAPSPSIHPSIHRARAPHLSSFLPIYRAYPEQANLVSPRSVAQPPRARAPHRLNARSIDERRPTRRARKRPRATHQNHHLAAALPAGTPPSFVPRSDPAGPARPLIQAREPRNFRRPILQRAYVHTCVYAFTFVPRFCTFATAGTGQCRPFVGRSALLRMRRSTHAFSVLPVRTHAAVTVKLRITCNCGIGTWLTNL